MKEYILAETENVKNAKNLIDYLLKRPKTEMVGLGLIYGEPGLGKSRFARQSAIQNDYIYFRLEATMTAKSFASRLLEAIYYHFGMPKIGVRGTANQIFKRCLDILVNYENTIIVIDEIDYAFKNKKILGSIRDIVDETLSIVVLVGMADAKENLLMADAHYFDRCNFFCEFKPLEINDMVKLCKEVCEVDVEDAVIRHLAKRTNGNIRKIIKSLYSLENLAIEVGLKTIQTEHLASNKQAG
jgi:Cdc6-like AAA superfamily ATPase